MIGDFSPLGTLRIRFRTIVLSCLFNLRKKTTSGPKLLLNNPNRCVYWVQNQTLFQARFAFKRALYIRQLAVIGELRH
jgi:hypothetical protein